MQIPSKESVPTSTITKFIGKLIALVDTINYHRKQLQIFLNTTDYGIDSHSLDSNLSTCSRLRKIKQNQESH